MGTNNLPSASIMDLLLDAVCAVDSDGRFVFVSAACERIFGYTADEMVGTLMIDMVAPEDRARTLAAVDEIMSGAPKPLFENRYVRKDGRRVDIMWSARWSEPDQVRIAVARDVTDSKRAESMRAAMYAISEAAHAAGDLQALFPLIHRIVNELLPAPGLTIALHDEATGQVGFAYDVDATGQPAGARLAAAKALCQLVMRGARPLLLTPDTLPNFPQALRATLAGRPPCWLGVPLTARKGVLGALLVEGSPDAPPYTEQDKELLQFVSAQVATAMERKQLQDQLLFMAQYDALTRLPNRQFLHDRLDTALARARRGATGFSLLYLDLDKFKQVNDRFGHAAGDHLLQEVAGRISACVRAVDTVARIGGDEFVVLLEQVVLAGDAALVADKIRDAVMQPVALGERSVQTCPSIGVAIYPQDGDSAQRLLKHADTQMYLAKQRRAGGAPAPAGLTHA